MTINGGEPQLISGDSCTYGDGRKRRRRPRLRIPVTDKRILEETYKLCKDLCGRRHRRFAGHRGKRKPSWRLTTQRQRYWPTTQQPRRRSMRLGRPAERHPLSGLPGRATRAHWKSCITLSGLVEDDFTSDSWAAFAGAMAQAAEVIADGEPLEADVTKAYDGLLNAAEGPGACSDQAA